MCYYDRNREEYTAIANLWWQSAQVPVCLIRSIRSILQSMCRVRVEYVQ